MFYDDRTFDARAASRLLGGDSQLLVFFLLARPSAQEFLDAFLKGLCIFVAPKFAGGFYQFFQLNSAMFHILK